MSRTTPGPWKAYVGDEQPQIFYKRIICLIENNPDSYLSVVTQGAETCHVDEYKGNARLIAAAPDLLEAAKIARMYLSHEWIERAIAKAEGEAVSK